MTNAERRQKLFDTFAANYSYCATQDHGKFLCPICASPHGPESTRAESFSVDLAHVYPESCGGKLVTLTCSKCNSTLGSKYDSQLKIEHQSYDDVKARGLTARVHFYGGSVGVKFTRTGDHFHFNVASEHSNPAELEAFKAHMLNKGAKFTIKFKWIDPDRHNAAVLHSAYLTLFRQFGYEYIAVADTQWIRDILLAEKPPSDPFIMTMPVTPEMSFDTQSLFASGLVEFGGNRFLCVVLPSPQPDQTARIVILPGIGEKSAEAYRRLLREPEPTEPIEARYYFEYDRTPEPRLASRKGVGFFQWVWSKPIRRDPV
jgi:hypothetical protein